MKADDIHNKILDELVKPELDRKVLRDLVFDLRSAAMKETADDISKIFLGTISQQNKKLI